MSTTNDPNLEADTQEAIALLKARNSPKYVAAYLGRPIKWAQDIARAQRHLARRDAREALHKSLLASQIRSPHDWNRLHEALVTILSIVDGTREHRMMRVARTARAALGLPADY